MRAPLLWHFARVAAMNELQHRVNLWVSVVQSMIAIGAGLAVIAVVYAHVDNLSGWSRAELYVVLGVFTAVGGVTRTVIKPSMLQLVEDVRQGTLDYVLTKPVDAQLHVSLRRIHLWRAVDIPVGGALAVWGLGDTPGNLTLTAIGVLAITVLASVVLVYCVLLCLAASAFWFVHVQATLDIFESIFQAARYPVGMYPGWLRIFLSAIVPVGFAVTVPAEALVGRLPPTTLAAVCALAACWLALSRLIWRASLRRYTGASA